MEPQLNCPNCNQNILVQDYFCPNCGKKLKDKPQPVTVGRQILVYLLSFLLPPLGLWPAVKYLRQKDDKSRMIGFVSVVLTIISIVITVWLTMGFVNAVNQQLNSSLNYSF
jgi:hypothetical protein